MYQSFIQIIHTAGTPSGKDYTGDFCWTFHARKLKGVIDENALAGIVVLVLTALQLSDQHNQSL
jgi:hypothetical protein